MSVARSVVLGRRVLASVSSAVAMLAMAVLTEAVSVAPDAVSAHAGVRADLSEQNAAVVSALPDAVASVPDAVADAFGEGGQLSSVVGAVPGHKMPVAMPDSGVLVFRPPVEAPVSDPFRKPEGPYGPGNRGIEYATGVGDVVRAGADGVVSFAGPVAGDLYVTLDHGGGLLSSYSYLSRMSVFQGDRVVRGDVIAFAGERPFHFSVRVDGDYVDPAAFIGVRRVSVRLLSIGPYR